MKDELISFETAKLAKEKQFYLEYPYFYYEKDEDSNEYDLNHIEYNSCGPHHPLSELYKSNKEDWYICTTQSLLQRWLREKHNVIIEIHMFQTTPDYRYKIWTNPEKGKNCSNIKSEEIFISYEKALEKGLQEGLKLIK